MTSQKTYLGKILVVDDDLDMLLLMKNSLEYEGFRIETASNKQEMIEYLERFSFDLILLDLFIDKENTIDAIPEILHISPFSQVVVLTAFGSIDLAVHAMKKGATTFLTKSTDLQKIVDEVRKLFDQSKISASANEKTDPESMGIVGKSQQILNLFQEVNNIKDVDAPILILGETGTGKELIARAIHRLSSRKAQPFEAVNCGAIPENLLESELFGYKKGSFTDAKTDRQGIFELCNKGVLLLDEIGEMTIPLQVKLLRAIQEKEIRPIGSPKSIPIETRVIASTNRDLKKEVAKGSFREDLFYRISVFTVEVPPLRGRREDIPFLVEHFLKIFNARYNKNITPPQQNLYAKLMAYDWPGNIRELQNAIERAMVLSKDDDLHIEHIFARKQDYSRHEGNGTNETMPLSYQEAKENFERSFLMNLLTVTKGNVSESSRLSGRLRADLYRLMKRYDIDPNDFK